MNRNLLFTMFVALSICFVNVAVAQDDVQEILVGGNMEEETAWEVYYLNSDVPVDFQFNYTDDAPSAGAGGCLWVYGETTNEINILFWQEVTLVGGGTYEISGAFMDLTGGGLDQFWCDIVLSTEAPVEGVNYRPVEDSNSDIRLSMNTWSGCGSGVDGTFQDDGCNGTGSSFTVPDTLGETVTYYFGVKPGIYAGGPTYSFEILLDEMSLKGPAAAGSASVDKPKQTANNFALHQNYPNPFNPSTQINYTLESQQNVTLSIYNALGELITTLVNQGQSAGDYSVEWNGCDANGNPVSNGIYLYKLESGAQTQTRKMTLMK